MKPTQKQSKEFWKWYRVARNIHNDSWANGYPCYDSLDNLFKYAVPKADSSGWYTTLRSHVYTEDLARNPDYEARVSSGSETFKAHNQNPALALFWALDKVREASSG